MATTTMSTVKSVNSISEKNKQWKNEALMEQLRAKNLKSFTELSKSMRMHLLEKRYQIDVVEKQILQTALDNMQSNIKVKTRSNLVERLETLTRRQPGLKFTDNLAKTNSLFISSDMFYLEIVVEANSGTVQDVKVHHECLNESSSEIELVEVLKKGDFIDFTKQLEGFQSIYQLNAESKIKSRALISIQALEDDLTNIYSLESNSSIPSEIVILSSSVGMLQKRRGGHAMRLTFFVRPTELLNIEKRCMDPLTPEFLLTPYAAKRNIGNSAIIVLEGAASNKLQTTPLLIKNNPKGDGGFSYQPITPSNSAMLPAAFVLRLNKPLAIDTRLVDEIKKITGLNVLSGDGTSSIPIKLENQTEAIPTPPGSLVNLIISYESEGTFQNGQKGLFLSFPDQCHCYFLSDTPDMTGILIKSIQFTDPAHVTKIIKLLRQQALFNALISSCVRLNSKEDLEKMFMFEVNAVSYQYIQIFVEHPMKESIVTVELNLTDVKEIGCKIFCGDQQDDARIENYALRVLQKSISIPQMLRGLIKYWDNEALEAQRLQKRLFSGIYANNDPKSDDNDDEQDSKKKGSDDKKDPDKNNDDGSGGGGNGGSNMDDYGNSGSNEGSGSDRRSNGGGKSNPNGQSNDKMSNEMSNIFENSNSFDICGINKNEIFFKTSEQNKEKRIRQEIDLDIDIFDQQRSVKSMKLGMEYDLDDENEFERIPEGNLINENVINENSSTSSSSSSSSMSNQDFSKASGSSSSKKNSIFTTKSATPPTSQTKPMDVFEFTPSPPSAQTVMLPMQSPLAEERSIKSLKVPTPRASPSGSGVFNLNTDKNRIHDIEIIPLKNNQRNIPSPKNEQQPLTGPPTLNPQTSITITPINPNFFYKGSEKKSSTDDKIKSEKKKKRKRDEGDLGGSSQVRKKSSESLGSSPGKKSQQSPSGGVMGKPNSNYKLLPKSDQKIIKKSPSTGDLDGSMKSSDANEKLKHLIAKQKSEDFTGDLIDEMLGSFGTDQHIPSPLPSPSNQPKNPQNRSKLGSLSAVINKLQKNQELTGDVGKVPDAPQLVVNAAGTSGTLKNTEYSVKSSSGSDGIKLTLNKTKSSSKSGSGGSKSVSSSPKHHTGLKPGVNSGPASKKSSSSSSSQSGSSSGSKNLSQKFLYQKSSSSGSLGQSYNTKQSSPKASSQSQPGKSSSSSSFSSSSGLSKDKPMSASKERSNSPFPSGLANSSKDMLKMLSFASQSQPLEGLMKSFDAAKKFQIPKLSARGKSDDKPAPEDISGGHFAALHQQQQQQQQKFNSSSAPTTPIQSQTPSPTGEVGKNSMEFLRESGQIANNYGQKYFSNINSQQNKFLNDQQQRQNKNKKLFKSVSSEQLYGDDIRKKNSKPELTESDFQAIFRSQNVDKAVENQQNQPSTVSLHIVKSPLPTSTMALMQSETTMMQSLGSQPMMSVGGGSVGGVGGSTNIFTDDDLMDEALNLNI